MAGLARILGMSAIALGLAACGGDAQRETASDKYDGRQGVDLRGLIGITKNSPDEFAVVTKKPLQMPTDFAALPPPNPGARSPLEPDPIEDARALLLGETEPQAANARLSESESALLASTGTANPDPNIRTILAEEEAAREASRPRYALEGIFPSIRRNADAEDALVPSDERVRLTEALPAREIGSTSVATIPSTQVQAPAPVPPIIPAPSATAPTGALPTVDPVTGGELIYIPE